MDNNRHRFEQTANASFLIFFANAQIFKNDFSANAQNTLSFFFPTNEPNAKKMKECFLQRFTKTIIFTN
jgi:hypothetical protein